MTVKLPPLRDVIARYGLQAEKSLGQNFLLDGQLLDRIAAIPGRLQDTPVYEVGPGPGGLTRALLKAGALVTVVERDRRCIPALNELEAAHPGQLRIIEGDALSIPLEDILPDGGAIVSNLPYNVGSALLVKWLTEQSWPPRWSSLTLMFQREVADRIVAGAGTDAFGRLSVLAQWRAKARIALAVHRSAFTPPPKVMSAVVNIVPTEQPEGVNIAGLEAITAAAFGQRRKMLRQSLKSLPRALEALEAAGIAADRRPETLAIEEFVALARAYCCLTGSVTTGLG
ncbi:16S rRNA (adenine(1518)-N(6)/adenine(1519)-N(6))-dimethyltransferase RsmA [Aquisediminimonas profunda]|uniref:16S rRNA (adenine(1518)-N(6)/adenine(1519)-N(6))- dimethyltransferase RsmA n=1 Tax=Aquisediminimonas profunda TaxID=1550733 RepID=UPI001C628E62|nr:16S rRNA (adenine(1518)-N(6)/adenine(1519)-N(6))-dimethyltransferase RsmA [Aquisediminimonas profunda]